MGKNGIAFSISSERAIHFLGVSFVRFPCHSLPQEKIDRVYFTTMGVESDWWRGFPAKSVQI